MIISIQSENATFGGLKEIIAQMELLGIKNETMIESLNNQKDRINSYTTPPEPVKAYIVVEVKQETVI